MREGFQMSTNRRTLWAALVALGVVVLVALAAATPAGATTGTMYITSNTTLTADHVGYISFGANSVTLDCAGHTVSSPPAALGTGVGISAFGVSNIAIRNCRVTGFGNGISLGDVTSFEVSGNTSYDNSRFGIAAWGAHGTITSNVVTGNDANGINVSGGPALTNDIRIATNTPVSSPIHSRSRHSSTTSQTTMHSGSL
jgi:parallel beta-helix repeat protein